MKKRHKTSSAPKRIKAIRKRPYPDADPEWEHLEERFSQLQGDEFRKLAEMMPEEE